jgi:hypothetical protein
LVAIPVCVGPSGSPLIVFEGLGVIVGAGVPLSGLDVTAAENHKVNLHSETVKRVDLKPVIGRLTSSYKGTVRVSRRENTAGGFQTCIPFYELTDCHPIVLSYATA